MNCSECNFTIKELEPSSFSFNKPQGACLTCKGLGQMETFDPEKIVQYVSGSLSSGAVPGWDQRNRYNFAILEGLSKKYDFSLDTPFEELSDSIKKILLYGEKLETRDSFKGIVDAIHPTFDISPRSNYAWEPVCSQIEGVDGERWHSYRNGGFERFGHLQEE